MNLENEIHFSWSGWQSGNITFDDDLEVDVEEIRELLDDHEEQPTC